MSAWVAEFLIATTLLLALVLVARPLVRRLLGAGAAYAIWFVPGLSLLIPKADPLPGMSAPGAPMDILFATAAEAPAGAGWLIWPWAAGTLLFAVWHLVAYRRFVSRALAGAERLNTSGTPVFATDAVDGPAAAGLHTWRIFVPRDFEKRFTPAERELARRHELRHLSAGHLWANAAALGLLSLHWFNPLAYLAYRAFREDQELSCDAAVIAAAGPEERAAYGAAMVKSAGCAMGEARPVPLTTCPMTRADTLKRRLSMIKTHKKSKRAFVGEIAAVALVAIAGSMLTATSGFAAEPAAQPKVGKVIVKRLTGKDASERLTETEVNARCGSNRTTFNTGEGVRPDGKTAKTKLILCGPVGGSADKRLPALEAARAKMLESPDLDAKQRAQAVAAIDSAIASLKAGN